MHSAQVQEQLRDLAAKLDALLRIRYGGDDDAPRRSMLASRFIANEVRRWQPELKLTAPLDEVLSQCHSLSSDAIAIVRRRCLFYACDDLIALLVRKRIKGDAIAREEAVLYVQDRLQRDNFRRIDAFTAERGASVVTYLWQVVNNLLLDFLRAYGKQTERRRDADRNRFAGANEAFDQAQSIIENGGEYETDSEAQTEADALRTLLADAMHEPGAFATMHPLRERLREHVRLTSQDRVFLKAMFQYDMSVAEICALPGFDMTPAEAYRCYYRIMDQLLDAFKQAGLVDTLRSLVSDVAPRTEVSIGGEVCSVAANRIYYLLQADRRRTDCHVQWRGDTQPGSIFEGFAKVHKRLSAYFSAIDSKTALLDSVLAATQQQWRESGELLIAGVARTFKIGARYLADLRRRFGAVAGEKPPLSIV